MTDAHLKIEDEGEDEKEDDFPPPPGRGKGGIKACKRAKPMFTGVLCDFKAYRGRGGGTL